MHRFSFFGTITLQAAAPCHGTREVFFKFHSNVCLDTLIQKKYVSIVKINNFRGDGSHISLQAAAPCHGAITVRAM